MKKRSLVIIGFLILLMISACASNTSESGPSVEADSDVVVQGEPEEQKEAPGGVSASKLRKAREQWQEAGVTHYRIKVRHIQSIWHLQIYDMEVNGDEITHSATCSPAPAEGGKCEVKDYDPADFTVEGLFQTIDYLRGMNIAKWVNARFNDVYGYPEVITVDDPEILDEDNFWTVIDFEALP